ncbi:cytidylate kinase family protein [Chloroflexota bacterium]
MPIITISRGSYSRGKEIAEKVARKLGYECIGRETLLEASEQFNIPETMLVRAIHDAPSILERFTHGKEKYIAYIQAALVRHVRNDNVVYHGLAGHFLLEGISHVLKIQIISDWDDRVALEMERENLSRKEAEHILRSDDEQRRRWSKYVCGIDTMDPSLYDMVIHIKTLNVDHAVEIICNSAGLKHFQKTPQSQKAMNNLFLACEVRSTLIEHIPDIQVRADDGVVLLKMKSKDEHIIQEAINIAEAVPGVNKVRLEVK